ncbi:MAG: hypothetical protein BRC44_07525 [Cyanobacteria bacterium QS_4_48_99]|jgi:hypothetical protein|nr:MAG: hypothetical protein BRC44_07525 [Cyanobacteria bacterium QS_4_48_99]PSO98529.1 MAG: hypothetical protein BRC48_01970 [Cyanobacteria bacterium QS_9_48_30]PSP34867.1 MAG: hypothetical protein BRC57_10275 [Cyanobacteria bacterium QS_8_48_54]
MSQQALDEAQAQTRLLLYLWDMGGTEEEVNQGELTSRLKRGKEKSAEYSGVFEQLDKTGAITVTRKGNSAKVSLTNQGMQRLGEGLKSPEFQFEGNQVGSRVANALLKWLRHSDGAVSVSNGKAPAAEKIASYKKFKQVALDVYERLNRDYNLDDLVPIYRMRREMGDRVTRSHFNEWLLEMQANDLVQLQGGSLPDNDSSKIEDSIKTELSGLRCYAKRLS